MHSIIINDFITRIKQSDKRRTKYYIKGGKKKVPSRLLKNRQYEFKKFPDGKIYFIFKESGERVIANPRTAGTPKFLQISGNKLYSGFGSHRIRMQIIEGIKGCFRPVLKKYLKENSIKDLKFPIFVQFIIKDKAGQDVDNLFQPYTKSIFDLFTELKIIPDDKPQYIRGFSCEFIEDNTKKIMEIIIK